MDYSLRRWAALSCYATDGVLPIDNNPAENTIHTIHTIHTLRPIAIGRKNWLFAGSEWTGRGARHAVDGAYRESLKGLTRTGITPCSGQSDKRGQRHFFAHFSLITLARLLENMHNEPCF
jgi:hypothetical protein